MSTTPAQEEAMSKPSDVTVSVAGGLPTHYKLAHALSIIVAGVIAVAVGTVLADGTSVIRLKDPSQLPIATNPDLKDAGINHRLDLLLGPTYGVGLHHDQSGHTWSQAAFGTTLKELEINLGIPVIVAALPTVIATDDLKHPVPFLDCKMLQMAGHCAMTFGFIAEIVAVVMLIFHTLALAGLVPPGVAKPFAGLVWLVLSAGFTIVIFLAVGVYTAEWTCDNTIIPSIVLADHFEYNYGFYFACVGLLSSLLIFMVTLCCTSTKDGEPKAPAPSLVKAACGVTCGVSVGLVIAIVGSFIIAGAHDSFTPDEVDPDVNPCYKRKPKNAGPDDHYFYNQACMRDSVTQVLEQAGANVTRGYKGLLDAGNRVPITTSYSEAGLCPVNVHWHLGAEHLSVGEFDEHGKGPYHAAPAAPTPTPAYTPASTSSPSNPISTYVPGFVGGGEPTGRRLGGDVRLGFQCRHYDKDDAKFTQPFNWQHCVGMEVGQTYEIHWPHSAAGECGTEWQMQTPFYDGVFCKHGVITIAPLNTYEKIGVQSQVFTVVNDEDYYHDNLIAGAIVEGEFWSDVAMYTGSTTGTSRNNEVCSRYTPITWQVDRKCHMISASSFDKLCADMKNVKDDMSGDLYAHGARALVANQFVANNQQSRRE